MNITNTHRIANLYSTLHRANHSGILIAPSALSPETRRDMYELQVALSQSVPEPDPPSEPKQSPIGFPYQKQRKDYP
jgi:hypothetical protein